MKGFGGVPAQLDLGVPFDTTKFVSAAIHGVYKT
jgi:hypothetical protein